MSDTQVPVLNSAIQQTNLWLKKLTEEHHLQDRQQAYNALRAVLHALRDRMTSEQVIQLGAQLPIIVRGIYYEGWQTGAGHARDRHLDEFLAHVEAQLPPKFPRDPLGVSQAVFDLLWQELDPGESAKVIAHLPQSLRDLWPAQARR
jgi:uncharacterized protein (DUF2267 family)